tara:strand:+ start:910 stop:2715 length:1806 start_codon:yes stop_codon:yes gene_type:complete
MSIVTDLELLKKIKEKEENNTQLVSPSLDNVVVDPVLIKKLDDLNTKRVEKETIAAPQESDTSVIPEGSVFGDFFRTLGSISASAVSEPLIGLGSIATLAGTGSLDRAVDFIDESRKQVGEITKPSTRGAQENLESIGKLLEPVAEGLETVSSFLGDTTLEWTGSPELATAAYSLPTVALEASGFKGFRAGQTGVRNIKDADLRRAQKVALQDPELKYSGSVAEVKLNKKGQLVPDKAGVELVKTGIRPNDVAVITNSSSPTKKRMADMIKTFEQGKGNDILSMSNKTTKTIGESVANRIQALQTQRTNLGDELGVIVKGKLGETPVDVSSSMGGVNALLKTEGVLPIIRSGRITLPKNWEKGTVFGLNIMSPVKKTIEDVYALFDMQTNVGKTDLQSAHQLKKNLDKFIDAAKLTESGVSPNVIKTIAGMRKQINDTLRTVGRYGEVNTNLSEIITSMKPFEKYLKPGEKWSDTKVSAVVGEIMKTLSSDSAAAVGLITDLSTLEKTLKSRGMSFGDDPRALIQFRQTLLENFNVDATLPVSQTTKAAGGLVVSASIGNTFGAAHDAARLVAAGMAKKAAKKQAAQNQKAFNIIKMSVNQ